MPSSKEKRAEKVIADEETRRVAANFKRLRKLRGWTQYDLGKRAGISLRYVGNIEQCVKGIGKRGRAKWAQIFGVDVSEFLRPIDPNKKDHELALLKAAAGYSAEKIWRLIQIMPIMMGEGDIDRAASPTESKPQFEEAQKPKKKNRRVPLSVPARHVRAMPVPQQPLRPARPRH